ncbi:hypothetical protein CcrC1_gp078 [Caulobacter phage C1]|nr:hypothetical protein CcrC1_gp078 [Caulobacter phage C1]UTU08306.1 hypothetical protein CcrC2_gp078 [Caulobacter phage C2]UTU08827.1 hypothetical protein CcrJ4_gp076 [Caulobacter phage J4]UTU09380.1 hypothetical protein CcrBL47_gp094 [Caulobacter phage BL47]UTU09940.1 hypothetical protein CcrRB23_gp078 [Caulobacter phage RB23]WGN96965.1 hypothetical protein [Bertelyvirus sp.]
MFVKLTHAHGSEATEDLYVNPLNIIAIRADGANARLYATDGGLYPVAESAGDVAEVFAQALDTNRESNDAMQTLLSLFVQRSPAS